MGLQTSSSARLHKLVPAVHTPLQPNGSLNLAAVEHQVAHLLQNGIKIAFIGGSTGECHSLTTEERRQLAQRWTDVTRGTDMRFVVHVGSNSLSDARNLARHAESVGALAISALAPSYFKPPTLDSLISCCAEIASSAQNTPFYFYDIPSMTGVNLSMAEFLERAPERVPTLAGLKFTNSDLMSYQLCLRAGNGHFDVPYGTDEWLLAAWALGAKGAVGSTYNFAAPIYHRLIAAWECGDVTSAREEQFRSVQLVRIVQKRGFLAGSKAVMQMLGIDVGPVRLPLVALNDEETKALRRELEAAGFFEWI
jgi:N-acetylneuraminate lyase